MSERMKRKRQSSAVRGLKWILNNAEKITFGHDLITLNLNKEKEMIITMANVKAAEMQLKPCPFCDEPVDIAILDDEGNYKGEEYLEDDPYCGLAFGIVHPLNEGCLLHTYPREHIGVHCYETLDDVIKAWNTRHNPDKEARQ